MVITVTSPVRPSSVVTVTGSSLVRNAKSAVMKTNSEIVSVTVPAACSSRDA